MFRFINGLGKAFWSIFDFITAVRLAKNIKNDPNRQPTSVRFGLRAMLCGVSMIVASAFVGLFIFLRLFSLPGLDLTLGIAIAVGGLFLLAHTIKNWVLQYYINKNKLTWISLAVVILCILASVAVLLVFAFAISN